LIQGSGITTLFVTHDAQEADGFADRKIELLSDSHVETRTSQ